MRDITRMRPLPIRGAGCTLDLKPARCGEAQVQEMAKLFAALADPTRAGILGLLAAQPAALCVCEVLETFPQGQPTISHHLKVLKEAGLVRSEKRGLWVYYEAVQTRLEEARAFLALLEPVAEERG